MIRKIIIVLILFCINIYAQKKTQESAVKPESKKVIQALPSISAQSQYSDRFRISNVNFTKGIDYAGEGEILEIQFALENRLDEPQDIFLFVIATFEKTEKTQSSFEMPIPEKERIRSFVPFPGDIKNFQYADPEQEGKIRLLKFPKNPKAGVNPETGKAYHLKDKLHIWTRHLSKYRNNYFFFNEVAILILDENGTPLFVQLYEISGKRT